MTLARDLAAVTAILAAFFAREVGQLLIAAADRIDPVERWLAPNKAEVPW